MANDKLFANAQRLSLVPSHPANPNPLSGQPCRVGDRTGVAITTVANTKCTIDFGPGGWTLPVKGVNDAGNVAVNGGDALFYVDADINDGTGFLSKKASGRFFGFAIGDAGVQQVASGATTSIGVAHVDQVDPGVAQEIAGSISGVQLATGIVKAKLFAGANETSGVTTYAVAGMTAADEIISILQFVTAASIATASDVTASYTVGAGVITAGATVDRSANQLYMIWMPHH